MNTQIDLKELERKAFRSTYQDGLWDILFGIIVITLAFYMFRPTGGYSIFNTVAFIVGFGVANLVFWAGKYLITVPRMGLVTFGQTRKQKTTRLVIILGVVVLIQVAFVGFQLVGWANPEIGQKINDFIKGRDLMHLLVASIGALFIGPSMMLIAYFIDFPRGYYIAILMALAVFLMIYLNQPVYPILIGLLILLPGIFHFVRFLRKYPLRKGEASNEKS